MSMAHDGPLRAIVWDFDGTLVDTREKNMNVNRQIVHTVTGQPWSRFPVLASLDAYDQAQRRSANWREFYRSAIRLSEDEIDRAGTMWTELQLADTTPAPFFDGVDAALDKLGAVAQAIVSQNARQNIVTMLEREDLGHHFTLIVGYEEVDLRRQKPEPDGLLACIERLTGFAAGSVLYVGDHETDARCALNANRILAERAARVRVESVGAFFDDQDSDSAWEVRPDYRAFSPGDVVTIVEELRGADQGSP
jgi:HAD superfamily hydrolase (TIGR01549 family)